MTRERWRRGLGLSGGRHRRNCLPALWPARPCCRAVVLLSLDWVAERCVIPERIAGRRTDLKPVIDFARRSRPSGHELSS